MGDGNMETKDKISLGVDAGEIVVTATELAVEKTTDFFAYLREPTTKAEEILCKSLLENKELKEEDIDAASAQLLVRKWVKRIKNNKKIIEKANKKFDELVKNASKEQISVNKINDDWIDYYLDLTSTISNEAIQDIFSRLLLRETIAPGTVTKVMLNKMALLDPVSASNFYALCKLTYTLRIGGEDRIIPLVFYDTEMYKMMKVTGMKEEEFDKYYELCPSEEELDILDELGFVKVVPHSNIYTIYYSEDSDATFITGEKSITVKGIYDNDDEIFSVFTGYVFFTQTGLALYKALQTEQFEDLPIMLEAFADIQGDNWFVDTIE